MLEDQAHILKKILAVVDEEKPDGVLIAGDVYDKSVPSTEAVQLFDDFLVRLAERKLPVFIISGNHDSPERLSFANRLIDAVGIHLAPVYNGVVEPITLSDEYGPVNVYMLPFIKPAHVRGFFPDTEINGYSDAVAAAIGRMNIDKTQRNVLITHQFVTGAQRSDSEELSVGGTDNIGAEVFCDFDYVALGHIHGPQNMDSGRIRYCGSPLKYSFSEAAQQKSVTVAELKEKGTLEIHTVPLIPRRDMVELKGSYQQLTLREFYENTTYQEDYTHITLTDEEDIPDAVAKLRAVYHNLMKLDYDNTRTRTDRVVGGAENVKSKSPLELFAELYELQNNQPMSVVQKAFARELIESIQEGNV